jgi:hypothetical protein
MKQSIAIGPIGQFLPLGYENVFAIFFVKESAVNDNIYIL